MPLVTIYFNERGRDLNGLAETLVTIHRGIGNIVKDALDVQNVVVIQVPMTGSSIVFIDISCNFRDRRAANLEERHQKIVNWIKGVMRNNGLAGGNVHIRVSLAQIEYDLL